MQQNVTTERASAKVAGYLLAGWTCAGCGTTVPFDAEHVCGDAAPAMVPADDPIALAAIEEQQAAAQQRAAEVSGAVVEAPHVAAGAPAAAPDFISVRLILEELPDDLTDSQKLDVLLETAARIEERMIILEPVAGLLDAWAPLLEQMRAKMAKRAALGQMFKAAGRG